jgi:hypothetical protein|tara:strand:+ start:580 stop:699 length:120 start_codon:yes stop_codon:yes gene_type:complete
MEKENTGDCIMKMFIEELTILVLLSGIAYMSILFMIALI